MGAIACLGIVSATTVAYAWLAGPLLGVLHGGVRSRGLPGRFFSNFDDSPDAVTGWLAATLLAVTVARAVAGYGQRMLSARLGQDVVRRIRERMYAHLLHVAPSVLVSQRRGEIASRLASDAVQVQALVSNNLAAVVGDLVTLVGLVALAFALDGPLAAVALAAIPIIGVVVWRLARVIRAAQRRVWEQYAELSSHAAELGDTAPVIRAYGAESLAEATFAARARELERLSLVARRYNALGTPAVNLLGGGALLAALGWAGARLTAGDLPVETFVSFFAAMFFVYRPVQGLGTTVHRVAGGLSALDRIEEVLDLPLEPAEAPDARPLGRLRECLEMRGVHFAYRPNEPVLSGVDLCIRPGESVALVGPSGEGKTTLLLLMLGLLRADEGSVTIDGVPVTRATRSSWRSQFAWVTQQPLLFTDTVLANVALAELEPDRARARRALEMAGAAPLLERLPQGLDTPLDEAGRSLSGGERQRICIARALYRDAPILVFDEATSSLDGPSDRAIGQTIEALMGERTVVLVSHRLSTVRRADRVVVLEAGRVVETGSPQGLWETGSRFHELFRDATVQ